MLDWISTRVYARRQRRRLTDEGLAIVEDELRARIALQKAQRREGGTNGHPTGVRRLSGRSAFPNRRNRSFRDGTARRRVDGDGRRSSK